MNRRCEEELKKPHTTLNLQTLLDVVSHIFVLVFFNFYVFLGVE